jgi:hypothetical protein
MSISGTEVGEALATGVSTTDEALTADLSHGRTIVVPLAWCPRLAHATLAERANWRLRRNSGVLATVASGSKERVNWVPSK